MADDPEEFVEWIERKNGVSPSPEIQAHLRQLGKFCDILVQHALARAPVLSLSWFVWYGLSSSKFNTKRSVKHLHRADEYTACKTWRCGSTEQPTSDALFPLGSGAWKWIC